MVWQLGISRRMLLSVAAPAVVCRGQDTDYDGLVQALVDRQVFSGTVLVARGPDVLFEKAYGYANLEWGVRNTIDGKYRIGSISKQFTAACVALLAQEGRLDLDASVKRYYSEAPDTWKAITAHHLLTHTSGIPDLVGFPDFNRARCRRRHRKSRFAGSATSRSNSYPEPRGATATPGMFCLRESSRFHQTDCLATSFAKKYLNPSV